MIQCFEHVSVRLPRPEFAMAANAYLRCFDGKDGGITTSVYTVYIAWKG